jgi:FkbM family methyltransferase
MKTILDVASHWCGLLRRATLLHKKFHEEIILDDLGIRPLKFNVYSPVERYRVAEYGGEREVLNRFLNMLEPTDVVYDIGASVGLYTIAAASFSDQSKVYSFEPDPDTRARLQENVRLNQLNNVQLVTWAVSDQEGEILLYTNGATGFAPSLVLQDRPGAPTGQVRVSTCSLDIALSRDELPLPNALKIDIEGAEALCLRGCKQLLRGELGRHPRILLLELHPEFLPYFDSSVEEIKQFLMDLNYELRWAQVRDAQEHLCYVAAPSD